MGLFKKIITPKLKIKNTSIQRLAPKCKEWKSDVIIINTSTSCPFCKKYNRKSYSLYGWNKKYPKIPNILLQNKCPQCGNFIGAAMKVL